MKAAYSALLSAWGKWSQVLTRNSSAVQVGLTVTPRTRTDGWKNQMIFKTPEVTAAGGLKALMAVGKPAELLSETKVRMFSA